MSRWHSTAELRINRTLAAPEGFEPPLATFVASNFIQLSYGANADASVETSKKLGRASGIRTQFSSATDLRGNLFHLRPIDGAVSGWLPRPSQDPVPIRHRLRMFRHPASAFATWGT